MQHISPGSQTVTRSRFKIFLWLFCIMTILASLFMCRIAMSNSIFARSYGAWTSALSFPLFIVFTAWRLAWIVRIDSSKRTIEFQNLVSRRREIYYFDELDGYAEVFVTQKGGQKVKVVYLVKDRRFCRKLSGSMYANLDAMENALIGLKFLGVQKLSLSQRIAMLRNRPVL